MKNGDFIRSLDNDRLARFLWTWGINNICSFLTQGGQELMHGAAIRKWLDSDEFLCAETRVSEEFSYYQNFNMKEGAV